MGHSDSITEFILSLFDDSEDGVVLQRNELAQKFNVVPSQINYVLSSRFTPEHGYIVESRRGGGGYIKIYRVKVDRPSYLMHVVNSIGEMISMFDSMLFLKNMEDYGYINEKERRLMSAAVTDNALSMIRQPERDMIRAQIMKSMINNL